MFSSLVSSHLRHTSPGARSQERTAVNDDNSGEGGEWWRSIAKKDLTHPFLALPFPRDRHDSVDVAVSVFIAPF